MNKTMCRLLLIALVLMGSSSAWAIAPDEAQKMYDRIAPSLVVVQYTVHGEYGRRELIGQGIVVRKDGLVMTSMSIVPMQIPDEQMRDFKIILPGDEEREIEAVFLGRDERTEMAFIKARRQQDWPAIQFQDLPLKIAEPIFSVGLLPKEAGYKPYFIESRVAANLRGPIPYILTSTEGLTSIGSAVFNAEGVAIGFVAQQQGQTQWLNRDSGALQSLRSPARYFVPARDFLLSLKSPPNGKPMQIPWLGAQLSGINKEVAEYYDLKKTPAVLVGEIIPDSPAAKAGLKTGDKITKVNGKSLERGDEPEEDPQILHRTIRRMNVGERVALTIVRQKGQPPVEVSVMLAAQPRQAHEAKRYYAEDLGMSVREIVFSDTYAKRVPADTKGVVVAYVRQASSAQTAGLKVGDLVILANKQPVGGLKDFERQYQQFREQHPKELVVLVVVREQKTEVIKIEPPQ